MSGVSLRLSREGVFPITVGVGGAPLSTATGLSVPGTVQGEGKLCGVPSLFVRLQGCNLRCRWQMADGTESRCDTAHTWGEDGGTPASVDDVVDVVCRNIGHMRHVVITGGEPYLQPQGLETLLAKLRDIGLHTTVETNGIVDHAPLTLPDLLSVSPKLRASGISDAMRWRSVAGATLLARVVREAGTDMQLKFVVASESEEAEIKTDYAEALRLLRPDDVVVMPLGASTGLLERTSRVALRMAVANGWRFGPRLHIMLFGNKEAT